MQTFGRLADGTPIEVITLGSPAALQARILTYGGILQRLTLPTRSGPRDLVLSLPDLDSYVRDHAFIGCIIGRYANRIAGASFELDGKRCHLTANDGSNHLHGGRIGFGKRTWKVLDFAPGSSARLRLGLRSEAGEEGYPGNLEVSAEFTLDRDQLGLRFEAISDAPTPVNLTYHPYFNLGWRPARVRGRSLPAHLRRPLPAGCRQRFDSDRRIQGGPGDAFRLPTITHAPVAGERFTSTARSGWRIRSLFRGELDRRRSHGIAFEQLQRGAAHSQRSARSAVLWRPGAVAWAFSPATGYLPGTAGFP